MSNKMWDAVRACKDLCVFGGKLYIYYPDDGQGVGVIFNNIYEFSGLIAGGEYFSSETLSDSQKVYEDTLVKNAYDNWMHGVEYYIKALLGLLQHKNYGSQIGGSTLKFQFLWSCWLSNKVQEALAFLGRGIWNSCIKSSLRF